MNIAKNIALCAVSFLAFAAGIWISATLWQAYIKDIARGVVREELKRHFGE